MKTPSLVFVQMRRDIRRLRWVLAAWLGLLLLALAVNLGWLGRPVWNPDPDVTSLSNDAADALTALVWVMIGLLPALVVLLDSPARFDRFLSTRPMPRRDLFLAKALFVVLLVVVPPVLLEGVHLLLRGLPLGVVLGGSVERWLFVAAVAGLASAFAALWRNALQFFLGLAGGYGVGIAVVLVWMAVARLSRQDGWRPDDPTTMQILLWLYGTAAVLTFLAWLNARFRWGHAPRCTALAITIAASLLGVGLWRGDWFEPQPAGPAAAVAGWQNARLHSFPGNVDLAVQARQEQRETPALVATWGPVVEGLPAGLSFEWMTRRTELWHDGRAQAFALPQPPARRTSWTITRSPSVLRAWAVFLPGGTLFASGQPQPAEQEGALLGRLPLPVQGLPESEPFTLRARLEAQLFRWEKAAELPLRTGQRMSEPAGWWEVCGVAENPEGGITVGLRSGRVSLSLSRDGQLQRSAFFPSDRHAFVLYNPATRLAYLTDHDPWSVSTRGPDTAFPTRTMDLVFSLGPLTEGLGEASRRSDLHLVVLRRTWLGPAPVNWESPPLRLADLSPRASPSVSISSPPASDSEFWRRFEELKRPGRNASRSDVGQYLYDVQRLVELQRYQPGDYDPLMLRLASLVPAHLEVFLDALQGSSALVCRLLVRTLILGTTEGQIPELLSKWPRMPAVAEVALARGWTEPSRPVAPEVLRCQRRLGLEEIRLVALLRDAQTYPRLLQELRAQPSPELYEILRALPGIERPLGETVASLWTNRCPLLCWDQTDLPAGLKVAMRAGRQEALEEAYQVFTAIPPAKRETFGTLLEAFRESCVPEGPPPEARPEPGQLSAWVGRHRASDFHFDPAWRRFVLKSSAAKNGPVPR
jgi:hypothetical protein